MGYKCLLISTNQVVTPYPVYPLGVAHLVGALEAGGHQAVHYDILTHGGYEGLKTVIAREQPDLIGFSIRNLDTVDSTLPDSFVHDVVEIVRFVRQQSATTPIVVGGPAFSILPEAIMDLLGADYGIVGEGEKVLPMLADRLLNNDPPTEKILRAPVDENPWSTAIYEPKTVEHYLAHGGMLNIQTKRGCPYRCSYCSYPTLEGRRYRFRDPRAVAEDFIRVGRDHKAGYVFFTDSVFNDAKGHYLEVAEALVKAGNTVPWSGYFRPQNMTAEGMALLKRAGLSAMEVGADAASDRTLAGLQKDLTFDEVVAFNELAVAQEIPCAHFIIFGGPEEDYDTLAEGLANIEKLASAVVFAFTGIRVLPGTKMHARAIADGVMRPEQPLLEPFFYFSPGLEEKELDRRLKEAWKGRFDRVYPSSVMQDRITHLHKKGHIGPMWDLLVRKGRR